MSIPGWMLLAIVVQAGGRPAPTPPAPTAGQATPATEAAPRDLRGGWTATAGDRTFAGTWTARVDPAKPDEVGGSWALVDGRRIVLEGTWAATKQAGLWRGAWSARVAARGRGGAGRPDYAGTWEASIGDASVQSLAAMFVQTLSADVTGTWGAGSRSGAWRLGGRR